MIDVDRKKWVISQGGHTSRIAASMYVRVGDGLFLLLKKHLTEKRQRKVDSSNLRANFFQEVVC